MKKLIISHNDLDGVASALIAHQYLFKKYQQEAETILVDYDCAVDVILEEFKTERYDEIWILDLSLREAEVFKVMKKYKDKITTVWIDHHASSIYQDWMNVCIIKESNKECAASLTYQHCKELEFNTHHYDYLARYARDVDLWRKKYKRATELSMIISSLGAYRLYQVLRDDINVLFNFTGEMERALKKAYENLEGSRLLAACTTEEINLDNNLFLRSAVCSGHASVIGDELGGERIIVSLVDLKNRSISLRTKAANINLPDINFGVHEIAERFEYKGRRGGGHPAAAGAPASEDLFKTLSQNLANVVENIIHSIIKIKFLQKHAEYIEVARTELLCNYKEMQGAEAIDVDQEDNFLNITFEKKFDPIRRLIIVRVNTQDKTVCILNDSMTGNSK